MQRTFKYGDIQNNRLISGKELKILMYSTNLRHHIQKLYTFKYGRFFGSPCINFATCLHCLLESGLSLQSKVVISEFECHINYFPKHCKIECN